MGKNDKQKAQGQPQKSATKVQQDKQKNAPVQSSKPNGNKLISNRPSEKSSKPVVNQVVSKQSTDNAKKSIDDLFSKLAKSQKDKKIQVEQEKIQKEKIKEAKKKIKEEQSRYRTDENGFKYTEEGYRIYTVEELNIGKGGNTADCPFDCNCCF